MNRMIISAMTAVAMASLMPATTIADEGAATQGSPIYGVKIPAGYRQWELIAPAYGTDRGIRSMLGNDVAMKAYRDKKLPFPDGAILVELVWDPVPSPEASQALAPEKVLVPGKPTFVQFMVKDSKRYAATGGWGFGRFINGVPDDLEAHKTCFACHTGYAKDNDLLFTRFPP